MEQSRTIVLKKKPRLILDKRFGLYNQLDVGDKGQIKITGTILSERKEFGEDNIEWFVKTVELEKLELIQSRQHRQQ